MAGSLDNLATLLSEAGRRPEALERLERGSADATLPLEHKAELDAAAAEWLSDHDAPVEAVAALSRVGATAAENCADLAALGRARQLARRTALVLAGMDAAAASGQLPPFLVDPIDDAVVDLANRWAATAGTEREAGFLAGEAELLTAVGTKAQMALLAELFPDNPVPVHAGRVLGAIAADGLTAVVGAVARGNHAAAAVHAWLSTPTWTESRAYFEAERRTLESEEAGLLLSARDDNVMAQHAAILALVREGEVDPFDLAADPDAALGAANEAVRSGRPERLTLLAAIAPALAADPFHGLLLAAAALLVDGRASDAAPAMEAAASSGTPEQRRAAAARYRRLAEVRPDLADGATSFADLLEP